MKVGDTVRRIRDNHLGMFEGDTDVITKVIGYSVTLEKYCGINGGSHMMKNLELVKTDNMKIKVGDILKFGKEIELRCKDWVSPLTQKRYYGDTTRKVFKIEGNNIHWESPDYRYKNYYISTIDHLIAAETRVNGVLLTKKTTMDYQVGDEFTIKRNTEAFYGVGVTHYDHGTLPTGKCYIKKLNKSTVYFDKKNVDEIWYKMKRADFDAMNFVFTAKTTPVEYKKITKYRFKKESVDAAKGTIVNLDGTYMDKKGILSKYDTEYLSNTEWFEPVYEEEFKEGDWVVLIDDQAPTAFTGGNLYQLGGLYWPDAKGTFRVVANDNGRPDGYDAKFRKATDKEVANYKANLNLIHNIGTRNATLKLHKEHIDVVGKAESLSVASVKGWYDKVSGNVSLGQFTVYPDKDSQTYRIGCESENNRVSLNEVKKVIDLHNKLWTKSST